MLDWVAPTGGYLLTACFSSGRAAGLGVINYLQSAPATQAKKAAVSPTEGKVAKLKVAVTIDDEALPVKAKRASKAKVDAVASIVDAAAPKKRAAKAIPAASSELEVAPVKAKRSTKVAEVAVADEVAAECVTQKTKRTTNEGELSVDAV